MRDYAQQPDFYNLLIGQALINPNFCRDFVERVEPEWFTLPEANGTVWHSLATAVIKSHWHDYKIVVDASTFRLAVIGQAQRIHHPQTPFGAWLANFTCWFCETFMPTVSLDNQKTAADVMKFLVTRCRYELEAKAVLAEAAQRPVGGDLIESLAAKLQTLSQRQRQDDNGVMRTGIAGVKMESLPRAPTGVDFLDSRWGNGKGPTRRTACGIFMPMGGGKTTLGNQIAISQALLGKPAVLVIAEQGLDADYYRRVKAMATGISSNILEDNHDDIPRSAAAAGVDVDIAMSRWELVDKHLHWVDMVEQDLRFEQVEDAIRRACESSSDQRLDVAYIDWAGPIANGMRARGYRGMQFKDEYDSLGCLADAVAKMAQENEIFLAISQQIAANVAGAPYAELDQYCPMGNRMFGASLRNLLIVQRRCPKTGLQVATIPKSRNDPVYIGNDRFILRLHGDLARFEEVPDRCISNFRIRPRNAQPDNGVPKE